MKNAALYIGADPFTFNDMDLVVKSIETFGFIHIFLDRKNRDAEYSEYLLNYSDRSEIIRHDLKQKGITGFSITPVDETFELAMKNNMIDTLVLNFDYQQTTEFRMFKILQLVNPELNIFLLRGQSYIEPKFIKTLMDSDSSMGIYRKFCSEYAFKKLKIKTMKKIGLTGSHGSRLDEAAEIFKEHGFSVVDVDDFIRRKIWNERNMGNLRKVLTERGLKPDSLDLESVIHRCVADSSVNSVFQRYVSDSINTLLSEEFQKTFNDRVVVKFTNLCEFGLDGLMTKNVVLKTPLDISLSRLKERGLKDSYIKDLKELEMEFDEKEEVCDYTIFDFEDDDVVSQTVRLINSKIKNECK